MTEKFSARNKHLIPHILFFFSLCTIHILKTYGWNHIKRQIQAPWMFILKCNIGPGPSSLDVCPCLHAEDPDLLLVWETLVYFFPRHHFALFTTKRSNVTVAD